MEMLGDEADDGMPGFRERNEFQEFPGRGGLVGECVSG